MRRSWIVRASTWVTAFNDAMNRHVKTCSSAKSAAAAFTMSVVPVVAPLLEDSLQSLNTRKPASAVRLAAEVKEALPLHDVARAASACLAHSRGANPLDTLLTEALELQLLVTPAAPISEAEIDAFTQAVFCHWAYGLDLSSSATVAGIRALDAFAQPKTAKTTIGGLSPRTLCNAVAWLGANSAAHQRSYRVFCKELRRSGHQQRRNWGNITPRLAVATGVALRECEFAPEMEPVMRKLGSNSLRRGMTRHELQSFAASVDLMGLNIPWIRKALQSTALQQGLIDVPLDKTGRYRRGAISDDSVDFIALTNDGELDLDVLRTNYHFSDEEIKNVIDSINEEKSNWTYA